MPASYYSSDITDNNSIGYPISEDMHAYQLAIDIQRMGFDDSTAALDMDINRKKSQNTTECVRVPSSEHVAEIVGRQGCKIKALRAKTNTYIKTPVRGEEPVFIVTGRKEDVCSARREILAAAEHFTQIRASRRASASVGLLSATGALGSGSTIIGCGLSNGIVGGPTAAHQLQLGGSSQDHVTIHVRVPYRVVGLVVGPKGATIKNIQQTTHTYIVTPSRDKEPIFEITGARENVEKAREKIETHIKSRTGNGLDADSQYLTTGGIGSGSSSHSSDAASLLSSSSGSLSKGNQGDFTGSFLHCLQSGGNSGTIGNYTSSHFAKAMMNHHSHHASGNGSNGCDDGDTYGSLAGSWTTGTSDALYPHRSNSLGAAPLRSHQHAPLAEHHHNGHHLDAPSELSNRRYPSHPFHLASAGQQGQQQSLMNSLLLAANGFSPIPATVAGLIESALEVTPQKGHHNLHAAAAAALAAAASGNGSANSCVLPIAALLKRTPGGVGGPSTMTCGLCYTGDYDPLVDPAMVLHCGHSIAVCRDCHTTTDPSEVCCPRCHPGGIIGGGQNMVNAMPSSVLGLGQQMPSVVVGGHHNHHHHRDRTLVGSGNASGSGGSNNGSSCSSPSAVAIQSSATSTSSSTSSSQVVGGGQPTPPGGVCSGVVAASCI